MAATILKQKPTQKPTQGKGEQKPTQKPTQGKGEQQKQPTQKQPVGPRLPKLLAKPVTRQIGAKSSITYTLLESGAVSVRAILTWGKSKGDLTVEVPKAKAEFWLADVLEADPKDAQATEGWYLYLGRNYPTLHLIILLGPAIEQIEAGMEEAKAKPKK